GPAEDVAAVIDLADPQHRHLGHAAGLVEGAAARMVDQPLVGHVVEQALQLDLVLPGDVECPCDLALARRLVRRGDEIEDLLAGWQSGGALLWHFILSLRGAKRRSNPVAPKFLWIAAL